MKRNRASITAVVIVRIKFFRGDSRSVQFPSCQGLRPKDWAGFTYGLLSDAKGRA